MESRSEFIYYALSNASQNIYPNNKPQDFKIHLPQPLKLEGEWEVGISSAIYPYTWAATNQTKIRVGTLHPMQLPIDLEKWNKGEYLVPSVELTLEIGEQFFNSVPELLKSINEMVNKRLFDIAHVQPQGAIAEYVYFELSLTQSHPQRVIVKNAGLNCISLIYLPDPSTRYRDVWRKLGFEDSVTELIKLGTEKSYSDFFKENSKNVISKYPASITNHFPALYVYSPMIQYVPVGDTLAPLLGLLPIKGNTSEIIYERFDKPIYNRLALNYLTDIEITIKDDQGQDVQFLVGKTIFALHFRRKL